MKKINVERASIEVFGGCNYECVMCPQSSGRGTSWTRKMPLDHFAYLLDQLDGKPLIQLEGSGEAFMAKDLHLYIEECKKRNMPTFVKTNGSFKKESLDRCLSAGLTYIRFSVIGYDRRSYKKHMSVDNFNTVLDNILYCKEQISRHNYNCAASIYHLVTGEIDKDDEIQLYQKIAEYTSCLSYVWKMHNWSGNRDINSRSIMHERKSCGRPFANEITIRAGGEPGRTGAITPCTQTLGPPNEQESVLGYSDRESLYDIWNGDLYNNLRKKHREKDFDSISYCKNCDFLYDDPEVLVWTNDKTAKVGQIQGTDINLLEDFE